MPDQATSELPSETAVEDLTDIEAIKRRSVSGIIAVSFRNFFLQIIAVVANFLFGIFLLPSEYGIFFGVSAIIDFFVIFSDVGLAAALIQKKDSLTRRDLSTTFTIQQILVVVLVGLALFLSSPIGRFYNLSHEGINLFRALALSLMLASLKTIPAIRLERRLKFSKLVIPEILENLSFYSVAVFLAIQGFGVTAFTWAVLVRGVIGVISIYFLSPWRPTFSIDSQVIRQLLSFGAPFQVNSIIAFIKDKLLIAYLFKILSPTQVGYIGWAQKWSHYPLQLIMGPVNKVAFPAYSRLQNQTNLLKNAIEKALFFISLLLFPLVLGLIAVAPAFIRVFSRYSQWQPALPSLSLFGIAVLWSSISTTLTNTLSATGHINTNLKLMVMWTTLTWIATPLLISQFGFNGMALASSLVAFTSIVPIIIVKRLIPISVAVNVLPSLAIAIFISLIAYSLSTQVTTLLGLFSVIVLSGLVYAGLSLLFQKQKLLHHSQTLINAFK